MLRSIAAGLALGMWLLPAVAWPQARSVGQAPGISVEWHSPPPAPAPPPPSSPTPAAPPSRVSPGTTATGTDQFLAGPHTYAPRYDRPARGRRRGGLAPGYGGPVGVLPPFGYSWAETPLAKVARPEAEVPDGRVVLDVTPDSAQVYVDGFYEGTVADFRDRGLWLSAGSHRIELRADGFETTTFDVRVSVGETVNYRRELSRESPRQTVREPAPPKSFYVIPRCYAGDSAPRASQLPTGCSMADLRTIPPQVSAVSR